MEYLNIVSKSESDKTILGKQVRQVLIKLNIYFP